MMLLNFQGQYVCIYDVVEFIGILFLLNFLEYYFCIYDVVEFFGICQSIVMLCQQRIVLVVVQIVYFQVDIMGFIVKVRDGCMFLLGMYMFDIFLILSCNVISQYSLY